MQMDIKYFKTAWGDIKASPGWFGTLIKLSLLNIIPIFGTIVTQGYLFGWARDVAWGVRRPLASSVFANEDGKFWRRGLFAWLIALIMSLVPALVQLIGDGLSGEMALTFNMLESLQEGSVPMTSAVATGGLLATLVSIIAIVLYIFVFFFENIGIMRMSIYDNFGAGLQIGTIWKMFKRDSSGMVRIFLMNLIIGIITAVIIWILVFIALVVIFTANIGVIESIGSNPTEAEVLALIGALIIPIAIASIIIAIIALIPSTFAQMLTARAMGYWTYQFNVPAWRGKDDPLPFEVPAAQQQQPMH